MPMGKYLNKLDKLMSWSLISLNLQCYNHRLLSYNDNQGIHSLPWEANSGVTFLGQLIIQLLSKEIAKYHCIALSPSILYALVQNNDFIRITFVGRLLSGGWQYSHGNESNTVTAKEDVKPMLQCNLNTDLLVFIKLKFLRILNFLHSFQEQVMMCSSCNYTIWERKKSGYSCTWIYFSIYLCITYFFRFMTSCKVRRTVRSGRARNHVVYDVLLNFLWVARTFVYQPRVLVVTGN